MSQPEHGASPRADVEPAPLSTSSQEEGVTLILARWVGRLGGGVTSYMECGRGPRTRERSSRNGSTGPATGAVCLRLLTEHVPVGIERRRVEADEHHPVREFVLCHMRTHDRDGDPGCILARKAVNPGGDGRECDLPKSLGVGDGQARAIAVLQNLALSGAAPSPNWADRMDHVGCGQSVTCGQPCLPRADTRGGCDIRREAQGLRPGGSPRRHRLRRAARYSRH
jgi:hypothetical protein